MRVGEHLVLRTGKPLQTGGRHSHLETAVDVAIHDGEISLDANQSFALDQELAHVELASILRELRRCPRKIQHAELLRACEKRNLIEHRQREELATGKAHTALDVRRRTRRERTPNPHVAENAALQSRAPVGRQKRLGGEAVQPDLHIDGFLKIDLAARGERPRTGLLELTFRDEKRRMFVAEFDPLQVEIGPSGLAHPAPLSLYRPSSVHRRNCQRCAFDRAALRPVLQPPEIRLADECLAEIETAWKPAGEFFAPGAGCG